MLRIHGLVYGRDTTFTVDIDPNERVPALWDACEKKLAGYMGEDDLEVVRACQGRSNGWLQTDSALFERLKARKPGALAELVKNGACRMNWRSTVKDLGFPETSKSKKEDVHVVAIVMDWECCSEANGNAVCRENPDQNEAGGESKTFLKNAVAEEIRGHIVETVARPFSPAQKEGLPVVPRQALVPASPLPNTIF